MYNDWVGEQFLATSVTSLSLLLVISHSGLEARILVLVSPVPGHLSTFFTFPESFYVLSGEAICRIQNK